MKGDWLKGKGKDKGKGKGKSRGETEKIGINPRDVCFFGCNNDSCFLLGVDVFKVRTALLLKVSKIKVSSEGVMKV